MLIVNLLVNYKNELHQNLRVAWPIVARQTVTSGKRIFGTDEIGASQTARTLIDYADFAPLIERTLRERCEAWTRT